MNIAQVKRRVPITTFLRRLGVDTNHVSLSGWTSCKCPWHADTNPSGSFSVQKNKYKCWSCGVEGDIIDLACVTIGSESKKEALDWITEKFITDNS